MVGACQVTARGVATLPFAFLLVDAFLPGRLWLVWYTTWLGARYTTGSVGFEHDFRASVPIPKFTKPRRQPPEGTSESWGTLELLVCQCDSDREIRSEPSRELRRISRSSH